MRNAFFALILCCAAVLAADPPAITIATPMAPPDWAMLERELLKHNSAACDRFAAKYLDERGYLLHTPRWGTLDGPDDAIETFNNWTLLYALGGSESVLRNYKRALEGHYRQYGELRTKLTELSANGAYYKDFVTQSDWFHTGEGMRGFMFLGLADPHAALYRERSARFAGMYMNEDPEAQNYDPVRKLVKSIWNGSKGPMLRKATVYDWVGDPVPGSFHLLHNPARRTKLLNMQENYEKMLSHCTEYLDSVGDNFLNMASTNLGVAAFAMTGQPKYRDWVVQYIGAWKDRTEQCGGNIPSNIGLNGKPGGEYNGQWWKGTYGWNFTIFDGELGQIAHRNYFTAGSWPGFANALLLTGDPVWVGVLRRQIDNIYAQKKLENGKTLLPQMYGDPRGYKYDGPPQWYHYTDNLFTDRLAEIYMYSMDSKDGERAMAEPWVAYLAGKDPQFPERMLRHELAGVRKNVQMMDEDTTTPDTRLADYLLEFSPAETDVLTNLTMGAYFSKGRIWTLHARFRYFDDARLRPGLPEDVGALVEKLGPDSATLSLVNLSPVDARTVSIQAGGYGEHQFESATVEGGPTVAIGGPLLTVHLKPGAGARVRFAMARYKNPPTFALPWERGWWGK